MASRKWAQTSRVREGRPFVFTNCKTGAGIEELIDMIRENVLFDLPVEKAPA